LTFVTKIVQIGRAIGLDLIPEYLLQAKAINQEVQSHQRNIFVGIGLFVVALMNIKGGKMKEKNNQCELVFACHDTKKCQYYKRNKEMKNLCEYNLGGCSAFCFSKVARMNRIVLYLKDNGFDVVQKPISSMRTPLNTMT
jgi:hypothetical protein